MNEHEIARLIDAAAEAQSRARVMLVLGVIALGVPAIWAFGGLLYIGIFAPQTPPMWLLWSSILMLFASIGVLYASIVFRGR